MWNRSMVCPALVLFGILFRAAVSVYFNGVSHLLDAEMRDLVMRWKIIGKIICLSLGGPLMAITFRVGPVMCSSERVSSQIRNVVVARLSGSVTPQPQINRQRKKKGKLSQLYSRNREANC
ncbi:unnamed protein product [Cochlearia groenlandica]